ncbi:MAG: UDP-glucose 4-epimerase GalE [Alphaproteobacteria bacterium]|uniref:Putative NADH dehydrogenase n=1 Tax=viral metagenome TaxID=1070528 RepID=A0A6H1ZJB9_9ZZZZ|nr:UDP-glucose 4-epimerase GalE [Alphaproteobacteria bacterium]MBU2380694.1 UDP-glucose 4-epimerase GalE [Alphaproteobacteria bacterium]
MVDREAVLVTGGAGYIGSHAAKALWTAGYQPVVYDDLSNGHREAVLWGPLIEGDVRNEDALAQAMVNHAVCGVIHFAGLIEVGGSFVSPDTFWDHNVNGVAAVLGAMRRTNVRRLVFSSTAAVYGQPRRGQITGLAENHPTLPINPYGDTKLAAERMISASCQAYGLTAIALRYFNAAGADADGLIGEAHSPESHLIPLAIEAALASTPMTVNGADYVTPDGSCVRDYVHVSDLAEAHVLALTASIGPTNFEAINLGTSQGFSVLEVVAAVERAVGTSIARRQGTRRVGDPAILIADAAKAKALLGWRPVQSTLAEIVGSAVAWRRSKSFAPSADFDPGTVIPPAPVRTVLAHGSLNEMAH